jgi:hypothetical protein
MNDSYVNIRTCNISLKRLREMEQMDMPEDNETTDPEEADEHIGDEE